MNPDAAPADTHGVWPDWIRAALNLPEPASTFADPVDALHVLIFSITMLGAFGVFAFTIWCIYRFRAKHPEERTQQGGTPFWVELVLLGGIVTLFVGSWILGFRVYVRLVTPPEDALEVYVTAKQWMWKFAYPDGRSSVGVLAVPVGRPVRLVMTSRDVIHSFYVPAFRTKRDVVPGRYEIAWFEATRTGAYPLFCAEFCGFDHSRMRADVLVLSAKDWAAWAPSVEALADVGAPSDLASRGRIVAAQKECLACHTVTGEPHLGPTWVGVYGSLVQLQDGTSVRADEAYLTESMMDPTAKIVAGFAPIMPTYHGRLTVDETGALVEYIRSLAAGPDRVEDR